MPFFTACLSKENIDVTISLRELNSKYVGKKGTLAIETYSSSIKFEEDSTRKIYFKSKVLNNANTFEVDCGFSKLSEYDTYVFCNIDTNIPIGNYSIEFKDIPKFEYQGHIISISNKSFYFVKLDKDLIDLYSDKQTINIEESKDSYELKFNILSYNQEVIMLDYSPLECKQENNQLICQIKKLEIEKSLFGNQDTRSVYYKSDLDNHGHARLPLVGDIIIIDNIIKEKDVFVGITKLIENVAEGHSTLAYETNVTNIDKIIGMISLDFEDENQYSFPMNCVLRKYNNYPLYIVCVDGKSSKMHLKEITKEIIHKTAHIKYNFRIQPVKNEDIIYYSKEDKGSYIL